MRKLLFILLLSLHSFVFGQSLESISPSSSESNTSLDVVLTGTNTNFVLGSNTLVTFTPSNGGVNTSPLVVEYTEVLSPTELRVSLVIPQTAIIGKYDVLVQGGAYDLHLKERFSVVAPPAVLHSISPSSAESNTSLDVVLTGTNTNFVLGSNTLVTFIPSNGGVNTSPLVVEYTEVLSPSELRVSIFIPQTATIGKYDVLIQGGSSDLHLKERFSVVAPPAVLHSISPSSAESNTSLDVVLTGTNTNFVLGSNTLVTFTPSNGGVNTSPLVVQQTEVLSPSQLKVKLAIPATATIGKYDVLIQGGSSDLHLKERFSVVAPPAVLQSISPLSSESNTSLDVVLTGTNTNFVLGSNTLVTFTPSNGGVNTSPLVVQQTEVLSPSQLKVKIVIPANLCQDTFHVQIAYGQAQLQLKEAFIVTKNKDQFIVTADKTTLCQGDKQTLKITNSHLAVVSWYFNGKELIGQHSDSIQVSERGQYIATNKYSSCIDSSNIIEIHTVALPSISPISPLCLGSNSVLNVQNELGKWKVKNPSIASISSGGVLTSLAIGSSYVVFSLDSLHACSDKEISAPFTILKNTEIQIVSDREGLLCPGKSIELRAEGAKKIQWSTGDTTSVIQVAQEGVYSVKSLDSLCGGSASISVRLDTNKIAFTLPNSITLQGASLPLTAKPSGGLFEGAGIEGDIFTPAKAGLGIKKIRYTLSNTNLCVGEQTKVVLIYDTLGKICSKYDTITVTNQINKYDTITVTNNVTKYDTVLVNKTVFDTVTVTNTINKYDTITVTNNVTKYDTVLVNKTVFDTVTVTNTINKYDTITVTNNVTKYDTVLVKNIVFDTVTVTSTINKYDTITVTNNVTKYDTVLVNKTVFDTVTVTNTINKYDTITVTNNVTKYDTLKVNKYDTITIKNNVYDTVTIKNNVYDTVTITNNVTKYDTVKVTKYDTITIKNNVYDTVTITNNVTKYDTVKVTKYDTITIKNNVYDTVTITNNVTKYDTLKVTKYDTITIKNNVFDTVIIKNNVYDTVTITNNITKYDTVKVTKYDTITFTNNVTKYDTILVNKYDTITVTNNVTKYDTITLTDTVSILKIKFKLTTGIQANQMASMSLYPNPTSDVLHIEVGDAKALDGYRYRILDALGKEVYNELVKNTITEIPLKTLGAAGMYQLEVLDEQNVSIQANKIVLQ